MRGGRKGRLAHYWNKQQDDERNSRSPGRFSPSRSPAITSPTGSQRARLGSGAISGIMVAILLGSRSAISSRCPRA